MLSIGVRLLQLPKTSDVMTRADLVREAILDGLLQTRGKRTHAFVEDAKFILDGDVILILMRRQDNAKPVSDKEVRLMQELVAHGSSVHGFTTDRVMIVP